MAYTVVHMTRFIYSDPVSESVMELRLQPRHEHNQRCLRFEIELRPTARLFQYEDYLGNIVHTFDIPREHRQLVIRAKSLVALDTTEPVPERLSPESWSALDQLANTREAWEFRTYSHFVQPTSMLHALADEIGVATRQDDPLSLLRHINSSLYEAMDYAPATTQVDSPIDHALAQRKGVCQDFAHIMLSLLRRLGIPARYVSGYLIPHQFSHDRSDEHASHAWVEALLPELGWVGFDPTNNLIAGDRHIRVAVGRDYADVSPTRGIFKGEARTTLNVAVQVHPADEPDEEIPEEVLWTSDLPPSDTALAQQQAQQQQQQQ